LIVLWNSRYIYAAAKVGIEIEISSPLGYNYAILLLCELITETLVNDSSVPWLSWLPITAITRRYIIRSPFVDDRRRRTERIHVQAMITMTMFIRHCNRRLTIRRSGTAMYVYFIRNGNIHIQVHDCNHDLRCCRTLQCAAYISLLKSITERITQIIDVESTLNLINVHVLRLNVPNNSLRIIDYLYKCIIQGEVFKVLQAIFA